MYYLVVVLMELGYFLRSQVMIDKGHDLKEWHFDRTERQLEKLERRYGR